VSLHTHALLIELTKLSYLKNSKNNFKKRIMVLET